MRATRTAGGDVAEERPGAGRASASFSLYPRSPYRLDLTVWALRRRDRNRIDRWDGTYGRALLVGGRAVTVRVEQLGSLLEPVLRVSAPGVDERAAGEVAEIRSQVVRLLGVDVDLAPFYGLADAHPLTQALKDRFLGLRPPRFPDLFEALANAVANQQLSLEVGLTLLNRLTAAFGSPAREPGGMRAFPAPEAVLAAPLEDLRRLGFSTPKAGYLHHIAEAITAGVLDEADLERVERAEATRRLVAIRGVGRWSAEYGLLRGLGRLDVYPGDDVGARTKLRRFLGLDHEPGYDEIAQRLHPWQPYAGMLYFHLLLDGLAERGQPTVA